MQENQKENKSMAELCSIVRRLSNEKKYEDCKSIIAHAMMSYPSSPEPHNLFGIVLEKTGQHMLAMNHFRAAWALDPTYEPAIENLNSLGSPLSYGRLAYDINDCRGSSDSDISIEYDSYGVGHVVRRRRK